MYLGSSFPLLYPGLCVVKKGRKERSQRLFLIFKTKEKKKDFFLDRN
jgi:hypothetical protein